MIPHDEYIKEVSYNDFIAAAEVIKNVCESCSSCFDCYYYDDHAGCKFRAIIDPDNDDSVAPCNWNIPKSL